MLAQDWRWQQEQSIVSALLGFCLEDAQSVLPVHAERMSSKEQSLASSLASTLASSMPLHSLGPWKTILLTRPPASAPSFPAQESR